MSKYHLCHKSTIITALYNIISSHHSYIIHIPSKHFSCNACNIISNYDYMYFAITLRIVIALSFSVSVTLLIIITLLFSVTITLDFCVIIIILFRK